MSGPAADASRDSWDAGGASLAELHRRLVRLEPFAAVAPEDLEPMRVKGLNHAHVRVRGAGAVLRIPRLSAHGFDPARGLAYQEACFVRAAPSGATPLPIAAVGPGRGVSWGALAVEEIAGRPPVLPGDLPAIARALAAIHVLAAPAVRRPLLHRGDPAGATLEAISEQAGWLDRAGIDADARRQLEEELAWARSFAAPAGFPAHPATLAGVDTHPGNFVAAAGRGTVFVDLEKMAYGSPAVDLAHATIYTSTMWDEDIATPLSPEETAAFYDHWFAAVPSALGEQARPWCVPMRRLTWLRTMTWFAKWRVQAEGGAAWSPEGRNSEYMETIRRRHADYFDPATIERVRAALREDLFA